MKQLPEIAAELEKSLTNVNRLVASVNSGYGDNTPFNRDLERLMVSLNEAVRSMRSLADLLTRHPEALLKGRPEGTSE
jgi:paraquat-inducible protein B